MSNPFILDVRPVLRGTTGSPEAVTLTGPAPHDLGGELLAIHKDAPVRVEATLTNLGGAIMVDADIHGTATGSCARCLNPLNPDLDFSIQEVFALNEDTVQGDEAHSEEEVVATVDEEDRVDITQAVLDEAGLGIPFSPTCADYGEECTSETPDPDGVIDAAASDAGAGEGGVDPRWAGLAKIAEDLGAEAQEDRNGA
ncbi:YceD family protein [Corynebacterium heidelbergense]|uniref:DNA-binding protein n=1 Tax=Corynebacterium heidelbergense TaxID=2055947 RepID=A0A364VAX9_9CORY|nr:DUF177 domain-containing protein [Corynebacterium heidelbergense]RAV33805.1 hypothetical protein CWC39_06565 [Corynebacterium heidelbergense]WCZ36791.1 hypothetical protein CHEID_06270 [Corynebacterium heidelbergense]